MSDDKHSEYSITVEGAGLSIKRTIDERAARQIVALLMGGADAVQAPPSGTRPIPGDQKVDFPDRLERLSLREYLDETQAQRYPDKIVSIAEYLRVHEGFETATRDDIKARFRAAGEAAPANFARDFAWALKNGWIAEDVASPGAHYVTQKGRAAIASKFSDEIKKSTSKPRRKGRQGRSGKDVDTIDG